MLNVGNIAIGSGASPALDARVAVGAGVFAVGSAGETSASPTSPTPTAAVADKVAVGSGTGESGIPAYLSVEFVYRQDYGKLVLREQNPYTGQVVAQVPTEYHLKQYAASQRAQRIEQQQKPLPGASAASSAKNTASGGTAEKSGGTVASIAAAANAVTAAPSVAPSSAPAASVAPAAGAEAAPAAVTSASGVNITV